MAGAQREIIKQFGKITDNQATIEFYNTVDNLHKRHLADLELKKFLDILHSNNINYKGIDLIEIEDESNHDFAVSPEGIEKRDKKMVNEYLQAKEPVFGSIGYGHALGMQNKILENLSLEESKSKFHFFYIYSNLPENKYEEQIRSQELFHPLGITILDANKMTEEEIVSLVMVKIKIQNLSGSADSVPLANFSGFLSTNNSNASKQPQTNFCDVSNENKLASF